MPYICLIRDDIPDGTVFIKSLRSESQRVPAYDPPGQTRYVNRVQNDPLFMTAGGAVIGDTYGLTAYLADRLEPGGNETPSGTIQSAGPVHGDTVVIGGVTFTAEANFATGTVSCVSVQLADVFTLGGVAFTAAGAAADPSLQQFDETAGSDALVAASLALTINHPASQALLPGGITVVAATGGTDTVTITADQRGLQGQLAMLSSAPARLVLSDATMIAPVPSAADQKFAALLQAVGGVDTAVATSLAATINNAASQTLIKAANGGYTVAAATGGTDTVTLTPDVDGQLGAFTLATSAPARLVLSDDHLTRTFEMWTPELLHAAAIRLINRMDGGGTLTGAAINAQINLVPGVSNTSIYSPSSTATVEDILSILAGRGYYIPNGAQKYVNAYTWNSFPAGGFGKPYLKQDSRMLGGEIRPFVIGGDVATREIKPIRNTYISDELLVSLEEGEIAVFMAKPGMPPVTLWPHSPATPTYPWTYQHGLTWDPVESAQLIVVYNDDGTIMV